MMYTWTPFNDDGTLKTELIEDIVIPPKEDIDLRSWLGVLLATNYSGRGG